MRAISMLSMLMAGVGDKELGEFVEHGSNGVIHKRRRLSDEEQKLVGPVVDIRGTPEAQARYAAVAMYLPAGHPII